MFRCRSLCFSFHSNQAGPTGDVPVDMYQPKQDTPFQHTPITSTKQRYRTILSKTITNHTYGLLDLSWILSLSKTTYRRSFLSTFNYIGCKVQPRNFFSTPQLLELQGSTPQLLNDYVSGDQSPPQLEVTSNTDVERSMGCFGGAWRDV